MNQALFISFLAATFVILIAPGPSCALATSQAMRYGLRVAVITVIGDALGSAFQISIATLGLQVLIGTASSMLPWLQVVGGVYLLYLSYKGFRAKLAELPPGDRAEDQTLRAMFAGFLSCISNPKAIIFFGAFFPVLSIRITTLLFNRRYTALSSSCWMCCRSWPTLSWP